MCLMTCGSPAQIITCFLQVQNSSREGPGWNTCRMRQHPILEYPKPVFFPGFERASVVRSSCRNVSRQSGMTPFPNVPANLQYWMWWSAFQWLQREDTFTQSTWPGGSQKTVGFECEVGRTGGLEPLHSGWQHTAQLDCTRLQKLKRWCCHCRLFIVCLFVCTFVNPV